MFNALKAIKPFYWAGGLAGLCLLAGLAWGVGRLLSPAQDRQPTLDPEAAVQTIVAATMNSLPSPTATATPTATPEPPTPIPSPSSTPYVVTPSATLPPSPMPLIFYAQTATALEKTAPAPVIKLSGNCNCGGPDLDCQDFRDRAAAQACYRLCGGPIRDPFGLDAAKDGVACENFKFK